MPQRDRYRRSSSTYRSWIGQADPAIEPEKRYVRVPAHDQLGSTSDRQSPDFGTQSRTIHSDVGEQDFESRILATHDVNPRDIGKLRATSVNVAAHGNQRGDRGKAGQTRVLSDVSAVHDERRCQSLDNGDGTRMRLTVGIGDDGDIQRPVRRPRDPLDFVRCHESVCGW